MLTAKSHSTGEITGAANLCLKTRYWKPDKAKARIIFVHGFGEHSGRYKQIARFFTSHGFDVSAFDLRGHGLSDGQRFFVRNFYEFLDDLETFFTHHEFDPGKQPVFILGHSMGGAIVTLYALTRKSAIQGVILSGALLKTGNDIPKFLLPLSSLIGKLMPGLPTVKIDSKAISRDPDIVRAYEEDPLVNHRGVPAATGAAMIEATRDIQSRMHEFNYPVLILHGSADSLVDPEGSQMLYDRAVSNDKVIKFYDGFYHEIMNEPERERVLNDILNWINQRLTR
jgi:alpha-beta hydrolase superfamily lysophospholipase